MPPLVGAEVSSDGMSSEEVGVVVGGGLVVVFLAHASSERRILEDAVCPRYC